MFHNTSSVKNFQTLIVSALLVVLSYYWSVGTVFSDVNVLVSAVVGTNNIPPLVVNVNPDTSPIVLENGTLQTVAITVKDTDSSSVSYTLTAATGSLTPTSGILSNTQELQSGDSKIFFTYFSPNNKARSSFITLTLNDGTSVTVRNIELYVY